MWTEFIYLFIYFVVIVVVVVKKNICVDVI